jgi:CubicO group peptidase (beta-lactamase class C family)
MTKRLLIAGLVFISALLFQACSSVSEPEKAVYSLEPSEIISNEQIDRIGNAIALFPNETQLSIAFVIDSTAYFYGAVREQDTLKTIQNSRDVFEIGSISKVFTSTLLAHLIDQGTLNANDQVRPYLGFAMRDSVDFTFKQLANHTSGLPRVPSGFIWSALLNRDNPYRDYDEEKLRTYLTEDVELNSSPGEEHAYSNLGAGLLGYALEQVEGSTYQELLDSLIFEPYNMNRSSADREDVQEYLVPGLDKRGTVTSNWDLNVLKGAGEIYSSAYDLSRFAIANFDPSNEVLALQRQSTFSDGENTEVAMGWFIRTQQNGDHWYWHNGGTGGYRSFMVMDPQTNKSVIVLSNISAGHSESREIDRLSFDLMRFLTEADL